MSSIQTTLLINDLVKRNTMTEPLRYTLGRCIHAFIRWAFLIVGAVFVAGLMYGYMAGNMDPFGWLIIGVGVSAIVSLMVGMRGRFTSD